MLDLLHSHAAEASTYPPVRCVSPVPQSSNRNALDEVVLDDRRRRPAMAGHTECDPAVRAVEAEPAGSLQRDPAEAVDGELRRGGDLRTTRVGVTAWSSDPARRLSHRDHASRNGLDAEKAAGPLLLTRASDRR